MRWAAAVLAAVTIAAFIGPAAAGADGGPVANGDVYLTTVGQVLSVPAATGVLANDTGASSAVRAVFGGPNHGQVTLNSDGSFTYTPTPGYDGFDSFNYRAAQGDQLSDVVSVLLVINGPPVGVPEAFTIPVGGHLVMSPPGVLGNDTDNSTFGLTASLVQGPAHGTATLGGLGRLDYRPSPGYQGTDTIVYQAHDGFGGVSAPTTVTVRMGVNHAPTAQPDTYQLDEDIPISIAAPGVLGNDVDPDGDTLTAVLINPPGGGLDLRADGSFDYEPPVNQDSDDSFSYEVCDLFLCSSPVRVSLDIIAQDDPPEAIPDNYTINAGGTLVVPAPGVLENDSDPVEFDGLYARLDSQPSEGTLTMNSDGGFTYKAKAGGPERGVEFAYSACDFGGCTPSSVQIEITSPK